jgi:2-polyprenyl-6-methoxyphenol hydroxylase-like FAD-dependent oxidoreductase
LTAPLRIAVIGGGIRGLAAAVLSLWAEFEVRCLRAGAGTERVGGGINMAPNAVRVLHRPGFAEGLDREGRSPAPLRARSSNIVNNSKQQPD